MSKKLVLAMFVVALTSGETALAGDPAHALQPTARPDFLTLAANAPGVQISQRPFARPGLPGASLLALDTAPPVQAAPVAANRDGPICGVRAIRGVNLAPIPGKLRGCGIKAPVRVTSISGVTLSRPSTMDCPTAKALNTWVKNGAKPLLARLGGGLASLQVITDYSCRTVNNKPGARISEHGKGNALDISAFNLNNGSSLTVLDGWKNRKQRRLLKKIHRAACGPFGTVLGPDADRFHRNHFHVDTASYRGGSYCR